MCDPEIQKQMMEILERIEKTLEGLDPRKQLEPLHGWDEIARFLGVGTRTACRLRRALMDSGAIYYTYGKRPGPKRRVNAYPLLLMVWTAKKEGEPL